MASERKAAGVVLACAVLILLVHWQTVAAMAAIWWRSGTFAHGALVLPITAWLIWRARERLAVAVPRASWPAALAVLGLSAVWTAGAIFAVPVVRQLAVMGCLPAGIWMIFGGAAARTILFPLLFAFFAVPTGEFLVPTMMDITARGAVALLQLSGIPVYRDNWLLATAGGMFQVAEACSGVRYLIAAVVTAVLFGYLFFVSWKKRIIFIWFVAIFAVLMNVARAYIIICLAYLSDMRIAVGVDHFIYGWVLFGVLLLVVLGIGLRYADPPAALVVTDGAGATGAFAAGLATRMPEFVAALTACLALLLAGPVANAVFQQGIAGRSAVAPAPVLPAAIAGAQRDPAAADVSGWLRALPGWREQHGSYRLPGGGAFQAHLYLREPGQANGSNVLALRDHLDGPRVALVSDRSVLVQTGRGSPVTVREAHLLAGQQDLWVASWFVVGGEVTANPITAKLLEVRGQLYGKPARPVLVAVSIATRGLGQPQDRLHQLVAVFAGSTASDD